jgi:hypothetical protein
MSLQMCQISCMCVIESICVPLRNYQTKVLSRKIHLGTLTTIIRMQMNLLFIQKRTVTHTTMSARTRYQFAN